MRWKSALIASMLLLSPASYAASTYEKAGERTDYPKADVPDRAHRAVDGPNEASVPKREEASVENPIRKVFVRRMRHADGSTQIKPARDR